MPSATLLVMDVGVPPYGYMADKVPHPVPARRAEGRTKTRLVADPERAPVVHQIFTWRAAERLGYAAKPIGIAVRPTPQFVKRHLQSGCSGDPPQGRARCSSTRAVAVLLHVGR